MSVVLARLKDTPDGMFGSLSFNGKQLCVTVEKPWNNNEPETSCIPAGTYHCVSFKSPHNGDVWLIQNVPDRDMIEIHSANLSSQLKGCVAVGKRFDMFDGVQGVTYSKLTLAMLKATLPSEFDLTIIDPTS